VNEAIETWAPRVGSARACRAFGLSPRTYRYRRQGAEGRLPERPSRATPKEAHKQLPWKIPEAERDQIRALLCSDRFGDLAPAQVYATLLDEGSYLCSERTMYRLLHENDLVAERRRGHRRSPHEKPRVQATGPKQAWSWDISRLRGPRHRSWFYLYVVIDIFSRKIVAWAVDSTESDKVAKRLITRACEREGIDADTLTLHSDRGAQMTSHTIAELLEDLSVTRSLSRPRTSNDNPFSEAAFKTAKYRPDYPDRFETIDETRTWMRRFARWYNHDHYHSGIAYLHPIDLHNGTAGATITARQEVLDAAYEANPDRFRNHPPRVPTPPAEAWINNPHIHTKK
jgi:putative transposase